MGFLLSPSKIFSTQANDSRKYVCVRRLSINTNLSQNDKLISEFLLIGLSYITKQHLGGFYSYVCGEGGIVNLSTIYIYHESQL